MLDSTLGDQTDLLITEHVSDGHGATLANFALFDLSSLHLPRQSVLGWPGRTSNASPPYLHRPNTARGVLGHA